MLLVAASVSGFAQDAASHSSSFSIKISPTQFLGLRFPVILEKGYGGRFSTEVGVGPTIGKRWWLLRYGIFVFTNGDIDVVEKRKIGVHFQVSQKYYFTKDTYSRHYLSLFGRYGYFPTVLDGKDHEFRKAQLYLTYGFKQESKHFFTDYWAGAGAGLVDQDVLMPSFAIGVNIGIHLTK